MITLVLARREAEAINLAASHPLESAGVLLATVLEAEQDNLRILGREFLPINESTYIRRAPDGMTIASEGYVPALSRAETIGAVPIWFHTHPGLSSAPLSSPHDHIVDSQLAELFRLRAGTPFYGSLIASPRPASLAFSGCLQTESARRSISRMWCVGDDWRLFRSAEEPALKISPVYDRHIRAFGPAIQATLSELHIAIVGCGGTGSAVAEQLVRLGVRKLLLIDDDTLSISNVTRVYGSTPDDVGSPKVEVLRKHLISVAPDLRCEAVVSRITTERTARQLVGPDVIFGCTDDNAGRLVLSRAANFLLAPVIDTGVVLTSGGSGTIRGIDGRVTVVNPGRGCLVCRGRIDLARAASEMMKPSDRQRLEDEGYAPSLPGIEPAVITFTTSVAATAVSELLERLIGYGPCPRPSEILLRLHEREISTNLADPRPGHYCDPASGKVGAADVVPFLGQAWSSE